jgi:hypothetical protein
MLDQVDHCVDFLLLVDILVSSLPAVVRDEHETLVGCEKISLEHPKRRDRRTQVKVHIVII